MATDIGNGYVGGEAKLYYNAGTYGSPTWTLMENIADVDISDSRTAVAAPVRAQWPVVGHLPGAQSIELTFNGLKTKSTTDAVTTAMISKYEAGTVTEFAVADALIATAGTKYRRLTCVLTKADESQPQDSPVMCAFAAVPAVNNSGNNPTRTTVGA